MIIQDLAKLGTNLMNSHKTAQPGWTETEVTHALVLNSEGELIQIQPLLTTTTIVKKNKKGVEKKEEKEMPRRMIVPSIPARSSNLNPGFLTDNTKYLLGISSDKKNLALSSTYFESAKKHHLELLADAETEDAAAVKKFFEKWTPDLAHPVIENYRSDLLKSNNVVFMLEGRFITDDSQTQTIWTDYQALQESNTEKTGLCLVSGKTEPLARTHTPIKGIPGAQTSGAPLVSFNAEAFESFGKTQSFNSPISKSVMTRYTSAYQYLLNQEDMHTMLGNTMLVYWTEDANTSFARLFKKSMLSSQSEEPVQPILNGIFESIRCMRPVQFEGNTLDLKKEFHILGVTPNAARLSVRFYYKDEFGNILKNLVAHYRRCEIQKPVWAENHTLNYYRILDTVKNKKAKVDDGINILLETLAESVLANTPYPESLYGRILTRIRAESGNVDWSKAALIKAFLLKNKNYSKEELPVSLNIYSTNTAYNLGRLFSVLEELQKEAIPKIDATIRDKYFNTAAASPATVFPTILKLSFNHLTKIKDKAAKYDKQLGIIMSKLPDSFPKTLSNEEQGMFILGYYQQKQSNYTKKPKEASGDQPKTADAKQEENKNV